MSDEELAERATAWTWAARTMGVEMDPVRIAGLVEVTNVVPLNDLKPAISAVMRIEPNGFLPSPGAVVAAYKAISEQRGRTRQITRPVEMSRSEHKVWMADNNPEGWDDATWAAYIERMATDARFKARVDENMKQRHAWASLEVTRELGSRRVDDGYRNQLRRQLNAEAIDRFPRCNPLEDGWVPPKQFDPIASLTKRMTA